MRFISSILFLVIAVLLFFFFVDPMYGDVKELRTNVATYNAALSNSTDLQKTRDDLVGQYKEIKETDRERLMRLLPSTINNIELILEIEKIANLHGMPVGDIKFDSTNTVTNKDDTNKSDTATVAESNPSDYLSYGIFPVEFTIEGRYDTFIAFLKDLENNLRLVDVKSISFSVPAGSGSSEVATGVKNIDPSVYRYSLKIETYWLK